MTWTISKLEGLIRDEVEEHLQLEYKAAAALDKSDKKKDEISKDVSALANAAGGTLIYGLAEGSGAKKHLPEKIDWITDPAITKEWLENIILSHIQPRIPGLEISVIRADLGKVFVVEVPQSMTVHQAHDKKYYKRHNFSSVPMEDYEIRDVMNRAIHPVIEVLPYIKKRTIYVGGSRRESLLPNLGSKSEFVPSSPEPYNEICFYFLNKGRVRAAQVLVEVTFPGDVLHNNNKSGPTHYDLRNTTRDVLGHEPAIPPYGPFPKYGAPRYEPVFPDGDFHCESAFRLINDFASIRDRVLNFCVFADDAQPRVSTVMIGDLRVIDEDEV